MRVRTVPVKNVQRLIEATDMLTNRAAGVPSFAIVDGETGAGKTHACSWLINQVNGVFVRAQASWSVAGMLKAILHQLDIEPRGSCTDMVNDVVLALRNADRALFLDETDNILRKETMVEIVRDIHDLSTQPVILIGYKGLAKRLARYRQLTRRVLAEVHFEPADFDDARLISRSLCEVEVRDDLLDRVHKASQGSVGELVVGLARIESYGRTRGLSTVGSVEWGQKDGFFTGGSQVTGGGAKVAVIGSAKGAQ